MTRSLVRHDLVGVRDGRALRQRQPQDPARAGRRVGTAGTRRRRRARRTGSCRGCPPAATSPDAVGVLAAQEDLPLAAVTLLHPVHQPAAVGGGGQDVLRDALVGEAVREVQPVGCRRRGRGTTPAAGSRRDRRMQGVPEPGAVVAPGHRAAHEVDVRDAVRRRPRRSRRRRRAACRPRSRARTARPRAGVPSGDGTNQSIVVSPDGSMASGSTTMRSVRGVVEVGRGPPGTAAAAVSAPSARSRCSPPEARLVYDVRSALSSCSTRARSASRHGSDVEVRAGQLLLRLRPGDGLRERSASSSHW